MLFALIFDDIFPTTDNKERVQKKGGGAPVGGYTP